jgi:hypothetical protein
VCRQRGEGWWREEELVTSAAPEAETRLLGVLDWVVTPEDPALRAVHGTLTLSERGGEVDLGEVRCSAGAAATAVTLDIPEPFQGRDVSLKGTSSTGFTLSVWGQSLSEGLLLADLSAFAEGGVLRLTVTEEPGEPQALLSRTVRFAGRPPSRIRWPRAALRLRILDSRGDPIQGAVVLVDGELLPCVPDSTGSVTIRGFSAGEHAVVVAATDFMARALHLRFLEDEERSLMVRLRGK